MSDNRFSPNSDDPVVIVAGSLADPFERACLQLGCQIYGFVLRECPAETLALTRELESTQRRPLLVVFSAETAAAGAQDFATQAVALAKRANAAVAVLGLNQDTAAKLPPALSHGQAVASSPAPPGSSLWCGSGHQKMAGHELAGVPWKLADGPHQFEIPADSPVQALVLIGREESTAKPALVRIPGEVVTFLASRLLCDTAPTSGTPPLRRVPFGQIAPYLVLLRDAGGPRCWHAPVAVANLTVDDPRLVEPYGRLSYPALLAEMNRANFHTTIGFIPWNYDRNEPAVVELFRANADRLSLAVHGNNHEGYEFFRYEAKAGDTQRSAPLEKQVFNIRQGLARITEFEKQTGLGVDRVMVFPQAISPAPTLETLREQGFWATSNFSNVPLDAASPDDPTAAFRSALTNWHDLPALRRDYPHEYSDEAIAIDLFLGNPVLFMAHQDDFADGIDAFNRHAARVNRRAPAIRWTSLGEVSRQLHRVRSIDGGLWEVRMVSRHARITNPEGAAARFRIALPRAEARAGTRVTVDGRENAWEFKDGAIRLEITLPPNGSGLVEVLEPIAQGEAVPIARSGWRKRRLRMIADFRDLVVSRSTLGQWLTKFYYRKLRPAALKSGRGRRRLALLWDPSPQNPRLKVALIADLPAELR